MNRYRIVKTTQRGLGGYKVEAYFLFGWFRLFRPMFWSENEAEKAIRDYAESGRVVKEMTL